jgi:probable HAF family extracellular repeat protein
MKWGRALAVRQARVTVLVLAVAMAIPVRAVSSATVPVRTRVASSADPRFTMSYLAAGHIVGGFLPTSSAVAINNQGEVAGDVATASGATHAFFWTLAKGMVDLGTLGGKESAAVAINDRGQIAGTSDTVSGAHHAFLWAPEASWSISGRSQAATARLRL